MNILYPFVQEIKTATGYHNIYLVEDNAPCHQIVQRGDSDRRKELGLTTLDWPSNTPDLNKIEQCWSPMKDEISIYRFVGASMETVAQAKVLSPLQLYSCANRQQATLRHTWEEFPQGLIDRQCTDFHNKCELVLRYQGHNCING